MCDDEAANCRVLSDGSIDWKEVSRASVRFDYDLENVWQFKVGGLLRVPKILGCCLLGTSFICCGLASSDQGVRLEIACYTAPVVLLAIHLPYLLELSAVRDMCSTTSNIKGGHGILSMARMFCGDAAMTSTARIEHAA